MVGFTFIFFLVWFITIAGIWHLYNEYFKDDY